MLTGVNPQQQDGVEHFCKPWYNPHCSSLARVVHHVHVALGRRVELHDSLDPIPWGSRDLYTQGVEHARPKTWQAPLLFAFQYKTPPATITLLYPVTRGRPGADRWLRKRLRLRPQLAASLCGHLSPSFLPSNLCVKYAHGKTRLGTAWGPHPPGASFVPLSKLIPNVGTESVSKGDSDAALLIQLGFL